MRLSFIIGLAYKNIRKNMLRSLLTIGGIVIGVGFTIVLIALGYGLQNLSVSEIVNIQSMNTVDVDVSQSKIMSIGYKELSGINEIEGVDKVIPRVALASKIKYNGSSVDAVSYGKNNEYLKLDGFNIAAGHVYSKNNKNEILVNTAVLKALGFKVYAKAIGSKIDAAMVFPSYLLGGAKSGKVVKKSFIISGYFEAQESPYLYMPLDVLKSLGLEKFTGAKLQVNNAYNVGQVTKKIESMDYKAFTPQQTLNQVNWVFTIFKMAILMFGIVAVFVACLAMFNTLTISFIEKTKEVGALRALGTSRRDVRRLFLAEAVIIGFIGSLAGIIGGASIGALVNFGISVLAKVSGNQPVSLFYIPFLIVLITFFVTLAISFFTGFYPAWRAANINPLDALRYE